MFGSGDVIQPAEDAVEVLEDEIHRILYDAIIESSKFSRDGSVKYEPLLRCVAGMKDRRLERKAGNILLYGVFFRNRRNKALITFPLLALTRF